MFDKCDYRYKRYIKPIVSLSIDFYVRIFVRVYTSPMEVKSSASKLAYVYQVSGMGPSCSGYVQSSIMF